ncbi:MAG: CAP domain-containing protein [Pyrinomonadaceae bacterium]
MNVSNSEPRADLAKRVPAGEIAGLEHHLFDLLNAARAENGLESLRWDENVAALARIHSRNMADYRFFNHRGTDGQTVDGRAADLGMGDWLGIGENIASMKGYDDPCAIAAANWMKSPAHRQNLLSGRWNQSAVGIAIAEDGTYYFTQVFMLR